MTRIKVRFNLSRGINYMKWKITYPDGNVEYHIPTDVQLVMKNCELKNNRNIASKIFNGASKEVCAWILCEEVEIVTENFNSLNIAGKQIKYNPKIQPNWVMDEINVDGLKANQIESIDYSLFVTK